MLIQAQRYLITVCVFHLQRHHYQSDFRDDYEENEFKLRLKIK